MLQGLAVYLLWFCILLSFKFFLLSEESIAENHWCSLRSAQTHVKENWGFVSPSFFPLILDGHNNGICQLRLLLLEPQMPCPKCLHLSGQFWSLCYCVISGGTQHPPSPPHPRISAMRSRIFSIWRVFILLRGDSSVSGAWCSSVCRVCGVACTSGLKMGM